jgi:hypothetical protein
VQVDKVCRLWVEGGKVSPLQWCYRQALVEALREPGKAVAEVELFESFHLPKMAMPANLFNHK